MIDESFFEYEPLNGLPVIAGSQSSSPAPMAPASVMIHRHRRPRVTSPKSDAAGAQGLAGDKISDKLSD